MIHGQENIKLS